MITKLTYENDCVCVHAGDTTLKTTKAFTHGGIVFDENIRQVTFAQLPAVAIPEGLKLKAGTTLKFQLVAPDGTWRPQTRSGVLTANEKQPELLHIAGMSKTPRRFPADEGWSNAVYKYRAYCTHTGLNTDHEIPQWLAESIARQKAFWNRLAWLCRAARRQCSAVAPEAIADFVQKTILPEIDAFNDSLGVSKEKIKHPAKLKIEEPGVDGLWHFVGELRGRIKKGKRVPDGLLEKVTAFAEQFKPDYTPLNQFLADLQQTVKKEAEALKLRSFEIRPVATAFKATLDRRKSQKLPWSEGWPLIKYNDSPHSGDWGLHYYFNKAGVWSSLLESIEGVPGLTFGPPLQPMDTNHKALKVWRGGKALREAEISIPGDNKERWIFRFAVLQTRALPAGSHVKEWDLLLQNGELSLCLIVELQRPVAIPSDLAAGLDIGWRRTKNGIRFGTLYEPASWTIRELDINLEKQPKDFKDRVPFCIDLGPTKPKSGCNRTRNLNFEIIKVFPEWQKNGILPNPLEIRTALQTRQDYFKDEAKIRLRKLLGENAPVWLDRAGRKGLLAVKEEFKDNRDVQNILNEWGRNDERTGRLAALYAKHLSSRIKYNQTQVALDVCRYLQAKGITRLIVEAPFLSKVAQKHDNAAPESLKRSQKYRQFAAPGNFIVRLWQMAIKHGIIVETHKAVNTTRICQYCNHLNPATENETYQCELCHRVIKQDHNAAVNLSRFACDPDLAEMALNAGHEPQTDNEMPEDRAEDI